MKCWKDVAAKSEGSYAAIPQEGGVVAVATPYDKELGVLNAKLARSTVVFGASSKRADDARKAEEAADLPAAGGAADRAGFAGKSGRVASYDLIDAMKDRKVKLEDLKESELPRELARLKTVKERREYLDKVEKERKELNKKVLDLDKKREEYIKKELAKKGKGKDSFDSSVLDMLRKQASKHDIKY
jgi:hypothetical protein